MKRKHGINLMSTNLPKFKTCNPETKEEKLIMELIKDLNQVTMSFIKLNYKGNVSHEQFVVLRDGAIGYCGAMVRDLGKLLSDKTQIKPFIDEAKEIYMAYMDSLYEK